MILSGSGYGMVRKGETMGPWPYFNGRNQEKYQLETRTSQHLAFYVNSKSRLYTCSICSQTIQSLSISRYVAGDTISVADILAACEMEQPSMAGYDVTKDREVLGSYLARVKAELNPHYDEVSSVVYKMRDKFGGDVPGVYPVKQ